MADAHKNFAYTTVATAPTPAASGASLVVAAGTGALFPAAPFNAVVWPADALPLSTNAEIVRVTGISTDTLTISRTQESTSARAIVAGDQIAAAITAKAITDVEAAAAAAQATADAALPASYLDTDGTMAANSNAKVPSQAATRTYVAAAIAALVASAPAVLDTLDELAAALGDDQNFATTVTTALAGKTSTAIVPNTAPAAGEVLVGNAGGTAYAKQAISGDATLASSGALTIANGAVTEAKQTLADNTTNDVSTTKHGYVPKAPNDTAKFLRGDATWAVPGGAETVYAVSGTTPAISPANGTIQTWTLSGNSTPTAGTWNAGESITLMIDDGTAYTITWFSITWVGGVTPTLATSGYTIIDLWKVGSTIYGALAGTVA